VVVGYLTVAVADELVRAGVPFASVSVTVTAVFVPATLMFLWAPLIDLYGRRQHWLVAGVSMLCIAAAGLALAGRATSVLPLLVALSALSGFGYSLVSAAHKGLAVELFAPSRRVAAAGWAGTGSGIGLAIGGGVLAASVHLSSQGTALLLIALAGFPALVSLAVLERWVSLGSREPTLRDLARDTGRLLRSRPGSLALAICVLPFASSGAALMVGALGVDFDATAGFVAGWAGPGKSLAFAAGALLGAWLWQRIGTRRGYVISGIGFVAFSLIVLLGPRTPAGYAAMACGFGCLQGASLSAVLGIILETVEQRAAATQAGVLVAAGNLCNVYLPPVAGWAHDAGGLSMLLVVDAAVGLGGLAVYLLFAKLLNQRPWSGAARRV
jgi:MFS family permease